jgi:hypothetical protein
MPIASKLVYFQRRPAPAPPDDPGPEPPDPRRPRRRRRSSLSSSHQKPVSTDRVPNNTLPFRSLSPPAVLFAYINK